MTVICGKSLVSSKCMVRRLVFIDDVDMDARPG